MPADSLRNVLDGLDKFPRWKVSFEIEPYSWAVFAKNDASFKFDKGVLTQAKSTADETVIPQAMVTALKTAAIAAMAAANTAKPAEVGEVPAPYLFRIDVRGDTVSLDGAERIPDAVSVTLVPQPKKPAAAPDKTANPPADKKDTAPTEEKDN